MSASDYQRRCQTCRLSSNSFSCLIDRICHWGRSWDCHYFVCDIISDIFVVAITLSVLDWKKKKNHHCIIGILKVFCVEFSHTVNFCDILCCVCIVCDMHNCMVLSDHVTEKKWWALWKWHLPLMSYITSTCETFKLLFCTFAWPQVNNLSVKFPSFKVLLSLVLKSNCFTKKHFVGVSLYVRNGSIWLV
jgi:hypothetical protein